MRFPKQISLVILALIASCGGAPDTSDVGDETQSKSGAESVQNGGAAAAGNGAATVAADGSPSKIVLAGFASRFVVVDTAAHSVVYDLAFDKPVDVDGHVLVTESTEFDPWADAGFVRPAARVMNVIASDDARVFLARKDDEIHAIDFETHAVLAKWRGESTGAKISPDGSMFVVWNNTATHVVRVSDGESRSYPFVRTVMVTEPNVAFTDEAALWSDAAGAHVVDRASFEGIHRTMQSPHVKASKDGKTFAFYGEGNLEGKTPGWLEIWRVPSGGLAVAGKAMLHIASPSVGDVTFADDASHVAWSEPGPEGPTGFMHVVDLDNGGSHIRFASKGGCQIAGESIVGFTKTSRGAWELKTDAECSPGCPSISSQPDYIAYDATSGRELRRWLGEETAPYNDRMSAKREIADALKTKLGLKSKVAPATKTTEESEELPFVHHPKGASVLVKPNSESAVRIVSEADGKQLVAISSSEDVALDNLRFTPDGSHFVAVTRNKQGEEGLSIWNTIDGHRVWSWR